MIEYIVLGIGIFLVFVSIMYTYSVDRKVNKIPENIENIPVGELYKNNSPQLKSNPIEPQDNQLKNSINSIGGELDDLIQELKDKEQEIKRIVNTARQWNDELADPVFGELLKKKVAYQDTNHVVQRLYQEQAAVAKEESVLLVESSEKEEPAKAKSATQPIAELTKYDKIKKLTDEGYSIADIAKQLNIGYREVELVVKMSKKGADTSA